MYDPKKQEWILVLNKYQRDNLLWLLNACGYPGDNTTAHTIKPFDCANTGDWVGMLAIMLMDDKQFPGITAGDHPNSSFEQLKKQVEQWARSWVKLTPQPVEFGVPAHNKNDKWH